MKSFFSLLAVAFIAVSCANSAVTSDDTNPGNNIVLNSATGFDQTVAQFENALQKRDITLMAKVDHAANAEQVSQSLRPTTLFIFGNPILGTQLMQVNQSTGLDLPLKVLIYENEDGQTLIEYTAITNIAAKYDIDRDHSAIQKINGALNAITNEAASGE